jgi:glutathione synthase/RimK-type ligase-like ATP-grasp enzyme
MSDRTLRVALATCRELPEPDPDEPLLVDALERAGIATEVVAWDGPDYEWGAVDLCILRSTWNYYEDLSGFLRWAERVASMTTLLNPLEVVRWNLDKRYLLELAARGVPVVPTELVTRARPRRLATILRERGWTDVVIKPCVGARSILSARAGTGSIEAGERHLAAVLEDRDALVQPYQPAVEDFGERSLVWIDGELTHSVKKELRLGDTDEQVSEQALPIPDGAQALARAALAVVDGPLLYARVDVVPLDGGGLALMELELAEPSLFFAQCSPALARFVAALSRWSPFDAR